jgi:hypothetical protein
MEVEVEAEVEEITTIKTSAMMMMHKVVVVVVAATMIARAEEVTMAVINLAIIAVRRAAMVVRRKVAMAVRRKVVMVVSKKVAMVVRRGMVMSHPVVMAVRIKVDTVVARKAMVAVVVIVTIKGLAALVVATEELALLTSIKTRLCGTLRHRATRKKAVSSLKPWVSSTTTSTVLNRRILMKTDFNKAINNSINREAAASSMMPLVSVLELPCKH